jgi:hypothetical protein
VIRLPGLVTMGDYHAWDLRSEDNVYRYAIGRAWDPEPTEPWHAVRPTFSVTAINPSKARFDVNDPTLLKLVHYAKQEGCGSLLLRNLAAYSATNPDELSSVDDPVGPDNERVLMLQQMFALNVAAWGNFPSKRVRERLKRSMSIVKMCTTLHVFGLNQTGEPKHPLYLKNALRVIPWRDAVEAHNA